MDESNLYAMLMAQGLGGDSQKSKGIILGALWGGMMTKTAGLYFDAGADITAYQGEEEMARINSRRIDVTLKGIKLMGELSEEQFARFRNQYTGTIASRTAKMGLEFSGSPIEVLVDGLTQIGIDEAITRYDLAMKESDAITAKEMQNLRANIAKDSAKLAQYSMIANIVSLVATTGATAYGMRGKSGGGSTTDAKIPNYTFNTADTSTAKA